MNCGKNKKEPFPIEKKERLWYNKSICTAKSCPVFVDCAAVCGAILFVPDPYSGFSIAVEPVAAAVGCRWHCRFLKGLIV